MDKTIIFNDPLGRAAKSIKDERRKHVMNCGSLVRQAAFIRLKAKFSFIFIVKVLRDTLTARTLLSRDVSNSHYVRYKLRTVVFLYLS